MKELESYIKPFCHISQVPVTLYDDKGEVQWECCTEKKICGYFGNYKLDCKKTLKSSAKIASQLGEPYIFLCPAGLVNIAMSLIIKGDNRGTMIAGPIAMGKNRENIIRNLIKNTIYSPDIYPKLTVFLSEMKIYTPKDVEYLTSLFNSTILSSTITNDDYRKINDNYKEQASVGERIQIYKKNKRQMDYPQHLEEELLLMVKNGDNKGAQKTLQSLLDQISLIESGNLSFIKVRVLGICAMLSRISSKQDALYKISYKEIENMDMLNNAESFKDLSTLSSKIIESFTTNISSQLYTGNSSIISKAAKYINENYMNKITLKTVAEELHTNHSYLSTLFKKEVGIGFIDYLNDIRIKRSQDLLVSTNLSLVEIAMRSGFDSQSYFTKTFKKKYDITPSEYRKINRTL